MEKTFHLQNLTTQPNSGKVSPAKFTDDSIPIIEHITNNNWMITTSTVLCIVLLLLIGSIQTAILRFGNNTNNAAPTTRIR